MVHSWSYNKQSSFQRDSECHSPNFFYQWTKGMTEAAHLDELSATSMGPLNYWTVFPVFILSACFRSFAFSGDNVKISLIMYNPVSDYISQELPSLINIGAYVGIK